jgi:hypothetical protein
MATPEREPTAAKSGETVLYSRESFIPPAPEELARRISNLEVIELLGQGGMGVVYKGRQPLLAQGWQGCLERLSRKVGG